MIDVQEKMNILEDMGIEYRQECPSDHGLKDSCVADERFCPLCWINALEG